MKEVQVYSFAEISPGTDFWFLCHTDMSEKLNTLFGLDYGRKFYSKYVPKILDGTLDASEIDDPEILCYIEDILAVEAVPVWGLTGKIQLPVPREVAYNLRSAWLFMVAGRESGQVTNFFAKLAQQVGSFFALPYDQIVESPNGPSAHQLKCAEQDGYLRVGTTTRFNGYPIKLAELTDKFCPVEKRELVGLLQ